MEIFNFYLDNILRPVFEDRSSKLKSLDELDRNYSSSESIPQRLDSRSLAAGETSAGRMSKRIKSAYVRRRSPEEILDLRGPKLMVGCRAWIVIYQIIGQLNWLGLPFYLSILYKCVLLSIIAYVYYQYSLKAFLEHDIIDVSYRNPIFIFIGFLSVSSTVFNTVLAFYTNLFNLCPLFKVLTTPKLCFITEEVQHIIGTKTISCLFIFYAYHSILLLMLAHSTLSEFVNSFNLVRFLLFMFCTICCIYHLVGLSHLDFYIRACFASWLVALKGNLEYRFAHLHKYQRSIRSRLHKRRLDGRARAPSEACCNACEQQKLPAAADELGRAESWAMDSQSGNAFVSSEQDAELTEFRQNFKLVSLDEIQKNLNTMDDHLEVWRSIQTSSLVLITLNAFLTNGALLLLAYNLLANRGNYYHGLILILLVTNYTIIIFFSYIGDSWLYYALSSFVQTVEDEYFLQGGGCGAASWPEQASGAGGELQRRLAARSRSLNRCSSDLASEPSGAPGAELAELAREHQLLIIRKKDVLFCREFLHQFENHLATPWSKLTVKVHLRMVGTFVTLIAAQIIFDHEH